MMRMPFAILLPVAILSGRVVGGTVPAASPQEMAAALERRIVSGDGVTLPDAERGIARVAGAVDLALGDWPDAFLARTGETICVAVFPFTGCYEFFDETGEVFWTVVPVLPTTENWVAPFRHAKDGPHPDDDLYAPWRLVDMWMLSHAEFESHAEFAESAEFFDLDFGFVDKDGQLRFVNNPRGAAGPATNLCITAFSFTETNLFFSAAWPTNETLPDATLDLYGSTNLLSPSWLFLSSHPATTNPVSFAVAPATLPWYVEPTQHVHDAACESVTNVVASPLDGVTVYTNVFWSCETNRAPVPPGFFRLGTRHDTDGDGIHDAYERLVAGSDPGNPDTDGDGVPDGQTWSEWRSHPLWAENGDCTNLVVFLYEPVTNGLAALRFDDLCIPLSSNAGPWCLCIPTNAVVDCRLVSGADTVAMLWYGPPEAVEWTPANRFAPGPRWTWDVPDAVEVPIWCDRPMSVFGGNIGGGSCRFARPALRIRSEEPGQEGCLAVCVHGADGLARFSWSVEPAACTGLWAFATGALSDAGDGRSFSIDVSDADPGLAGVRTGTLCVESLQGPFFGDDSLFGTLSKTVSAHRCAGLADPSFGFCLSCGVAHGAPPDACYHEPWCATRTNLLVDCDCAEPFVRIGGAGTLRLLGEDRPCCSVHDGFPNFADVLSAPGALHAAVSNGVFLAVAPESRSPTIGGFVARCRIYDGEGGTYRDLSVPFTCADLGIDPLLGNAPVPSGWQGEPEAYYVTNGTLFVSRRPAPYPIRLWNESPSDARLVFAFSSPTNGPGLFDPSLVTRHSSFVTTNSSPFSALNSDTTVYLDASCSNALATLSLTLSNPATNRTFLAESLSVQVVHTDLGEHWRVRSATDSISWDFSDAPEPVWICLRYPPQHGETLGQMVRNPVVSKTPSFSLDLPPDDYLVEAYFPRIYDGQSYVVCETNTLHVRPVPEFAREVVGVQCRTDRRVEVALTNDTFHSDIHWTLSPVVANGPRLFASSNSVSAATSFAGVSNVWVSAGTVPGVYRVTASYPGFTNATAFVVDPVVDINGDFLRNGSIADDPREADPVCFTNSVGIVVPCNSNDDDGGGIPDCDDLAVNGGGDTNDLRRIALGRFGFAPSDLPASAALTAEIAVTVPDGDLLSFVPASRRIRLFGSNTVDAVALGGESPSLYGNLAEDLFGATDRDLWLEGRFHGATVLLTLRVWLDGEIVGEDTIRVRVAPFEVLSNCDVAEKVFFASNESDLEWVTFASNIVDETTGVIPASESDSIPFPQDVAELGWSGMNGGNPVVWSMWRHGFISLLSSDVGVFTNPVVNGMGGNIEAIPPTAGHPHGIIVVGNNLPYEAKMFLRSQEVQSDDGDLIELSVDWLVVGHVDEVFSVVPVGANSFKILMADLDSAIMLLSNHVAVLREELMVDPEDEMCAARLMQYEDILAPYLDPTNTAKVAWVQSQLDAIRIDLQSGTGLEDSNFVALPVLFSIPSSTNVSRQVESTYPNLVNLVALRNETGVRRILLPFPVLEPFADSIQSIFESLGYQPGEVRFVWTAGPHSNAGEAHCATSVLRRKAP